MVPAPWTDVAPSRHAYVHTVAVTILVLAAVLSGCNAFSDSGGSPGTVTPAPVPTVETANPPTTEGDRTADPGDSPTNPPAPVPVTSISLAEHGVNANTTWNRTERLLGVDGERPAVAVTDQPVDFVVPRFLARTTDANESNGEPASIWYHSDTETVYVAADVVRNRSTDQVELALVHGYVHAMQRQAERDEDGLGRSYVEFDALLGYREGVAMDAKARYAAEYTDLQPYQTLETCYANATTGQRYHLALARYGGQYVERRRNGTDDLPISGMAGPPSTEQLLHDTDDAPRPLELTVDVPAEWDSSAGTYRGELATRVLLRHELSKERAVTAAAGWGGERQQRLFARNDNASGYVWAHRWDTPADADEFESAMTAYVSARRAQDGTTAFELHRVAPETTVVLVGTEAFVERTSVPTASNATVNVTVSG